MLEIYKRDEFNGKLKIISEYNSFEDLFRRVGYRFDFAECFGYNDTNRHTNGAHLGDHQPVPQYASWPSRRYCYIAYWNDKFVTPDRLVGLYRDYTYANRVDWRKRWNRKYDCGHKKGAYGWIRHMRTMQERRWAHAWDNEEFAPRVRAKRQGHHLPSNWDDYWAGAQKSWKRQSKRKHQWKEKNGHKGR